MPDHVSADDVEHVASLARIDMGDIDVESIVDQLDDVLEHFERLEEVPETERAEELENVMRPDEIRDGLDQSSALDNAPDSEDGYFKGPNVS